MQDNKPAKPKAYGCLIPAGLFVGLGFGLAYQEPSLGAVAGLSAALVGAFAMWLTGR